MTTEDDEPDIILRGATTPTARKEYVCELCRSSIHQGERYVRLSAIVDRKYSHHIQCLACQISTTTILEERQ